MKKIYNDVKNTPFEKKLNNIYSLYKKNLDIIKAIHTNRIDMLESMFSPNLEIISTLCLNPHCL